MQAWQTDSLVTLAITAFVVYRFVRRELKARVIRLSTLWIRPTLLLAILAFLVFLTLRSSSASVAFLAEALVAGSLAGIVTGALVVRSTTFSPAGIPGAVRAHGSPVTAAVWIGAVVLRLLARLVVPHSAIGAQLALNSGLVALVTVAFAIVAVAFARAIARSDLRSTAAV